MIVNIYTIGKKKLIVKNLQVKKLYDSSFYFRKIETIGSRKCREIIKKVNNGFLTDKIFLIFEDVETGRTGAQYLYNNGTILNF